MRLKFLVLFAFVLIVILLVFVNLISFVSAYIQLGDSYVIENTCCGTANRGMEATEGYVVIGIHTEKNTGTHDVLTDVFIKWAKPVGVDDSGYVIINYSDTGQSSGYGAMSGEGPKKIEISDNRVFIALAFKGSNDETSIVAKTAKIKNKDGNYVIDKDTIEYVYSGLINAKNCFENNTQSGCSNYVLKEGYVVTGAWSTYSTPDGTIKNVKLKASNFLCPDSDGDGLKDISCGGTDCDDSNADIYPEATEICGNDIDEDCNGRDDTCPHTCSNESQIILRLSHKENAHAELWNSTGNYPLEICFDEIFDYAYSGENPHDCNGNKVFGLSDVTNAHAEIPENDNYVADVCYGKLICNSRDSCLVGEELIVSLSEETNAHLSNGSDYEFKICCKTGKELLEAYWTNMADEGITEADLNDRVKMVAEGEGLEEVNFTLYKERAFWFDKKISSQSSTKGFITWVANETGSFYFTADSYGETKDSENIEILPEENNSAPYAIISNPKTGEIYYVNLKINFTQESYDEDDFFNYTWNFGDNSKKEGSTRDYENYNTNHSYNTTGQKNIFLEVKDERGKKANNRTSILVVNTTENEKNVFAHISNPEWGEEIYGRRVYFNASGSYAVETLNEDVTCIAGPCPEKTSDGQPVTGSPQPLTPLEFNWSFSDNSKRSKKGIEGAIFNKSFANQGPHSAKLRASINPSSDTETNFSLYFDEPSCVVQKDEGEEETYWVWGNEVTDSFDDCYRDNGEPTSFCCPSGYECEGWEDNESGKCELSEVYGCSDYATEGECEDYSPGVAVHDNEEKSDFGEGFCEPGMYTNESNGCSYYVYNCRCEWNETACIPAYSVGKNCETEDILLVNCYMPDSKTTNCSKGFRFVKWDWYYKDNSGKTLNCTKDGDCSIYSGLETISCDTEKGLCISENCKSGEKPIRCLSGALLGFSSAISLIIAVIIIIIFYFIVARGKRKSRGKIRKPRKSKDFRGNKTL